MGSLKGRAGTQLLAMSSVEKGPEISDTGAPAISEETEGGKSTAVKWAVHLYHTTKEITLCFISPSQATSALRFQGPRHLSTHRGRSRWPCAFRGSGPLRTGTTACFKVCSCWTHTVGSNVRKGPCGGVRWFEEAGKAGALCRWGCVSQSLLGAVWSCFLRGVEEGRVGQGSRKRSSI